MKSQVKSARAGRNVRSKIKNCINKLIIFRKIMRIFNKLRILCKEIAVQDKHKNSNSEKLKDMLQ